MNQTVLSRQSIAEMADAAAAQWVAAPHLPKPGCPFDKDAQPDHYRAWNASFSRALLERSAPDCEASA